VLGELVATLEGGAPPGSAADAFDALAASAEAFAGLSYAQLGFQGRRVAAPAVVST
jgi:hypothetical protein